MRQPGAIDFMHPLLQKWQKYRPSSLKIITDRKNINFLLRLNLQYIDIIPFEYCKSKILNKILDNWKPNQVVLSSNLRNKGKIEREEIECIIYAQSNHLKIIQYIDCPYDYFIKLKNTNLPKYSYNKLLLINEESKKQAIIEGVSPNIIKVVGHPSWEKIITHNGDLLIDIDQNDPAFKKLFPKIHNPDFDNYCILDPMFLLYSLCLREFIVRAPDRVTTINCTGGGSIFGNRITSKSFQDFLS